MKNLISLLLIIAINYPLHSQNKWSMERDSINFAVLVSNYQTYQFEEGNLSHYKSSDTILNKIPIDTELIPAADYGSITLLSLVNKDTLFSASEIWQGQGKINYPKIFEPSDSFKTSSNYLMPPLSKEYYYNLIDNIDSSKYRMEADSAWDKVKKLNIVHDFGEYSSYRVGSYLYTPGEAVPTQNGFSDTVGAKWITFLYSDSATISGIERKTTIPKKFRLFQNYPNPFNPITTIKYSIPKTDFVTLTIYDLEGRVVSILVNAEKTPGLYSVKFNASNMSSGIYFYRIKAGSFEKTKKLILLK